MRHIGCFEIRDVEWGTLDALRWGRVMESYILPEVMETGTWCARTTRWVVWDVSLGRMIYSLYICCCCLGNPSYPCYIYFYPLRSRPLKAAYGWWREPIRSLGIVGECAGSELGVKGPSLRNQEEGCVASLKCFLWSWSKMKTWSSSYRYVGFLLVV
jgi:hypothetical protein